MIEKKGTRTQIYDPILKRFLNPHITDDKRSLKDFLLWKLGYFTNQADLFSVPSDFSLYIPPIQKGHPQALWINHSTFFIEIENTHILTDPIWAKRCSPLKSIGPLRQCPPSISLQDLKQVDHVLISHNHYDHLDKETVIALHTLYPSITWWVPIGVKAWFTKLGITQVKEFGWWESFSFFSPTNSSLLIKLTAVPAQHFSGRSLLDKDSTLWVGWVMEFNTSNHNKRLYFAGDTGYNSIDFKEIGSMWPHMDLSLIPIGSYLPKKFMAPVHVDPEQAVKIHKDVHSKKSVGIHWGTFHLSDEQGLRPAYDLSLALAQHKISPNKFLAIPPGHAIDW